MKATLDREDFTRACKAVQHAVSKNDAHTEAMRCMLLRAVDTNTIHVVATDGKRLARWRGRILRGDAGPDSVLVRNHTSLVKWLRGLEKGGEISIDFTAHVIETPVGQTFEIDASTDTFPPYESVFEYSADLDHTVIVERLLDLAKALGGDSDVAEHVALLREAAKALRNAKEVYVDARYLSDAAKAYGSKSCPVARLAGQLDPITVHSYESTFDLACIVMPVRL